MKTITIQVPDDCEVQIVKKEEKKEEKSKFNRGDIIVNTLTGLIAVYERTEVLCNGKRLVQFSTLY